MNLDRRHARALSLLKEGKLREAEELYREILADRPDDVNALHFLGVAYHRLRDYEKAERLIRKALRFRSDYFDAHNNLGALLQETRRFDEALASYERALRLKPRSDDVLYNIGTLYDETRKTKQAMEYFHRVLEVNPNYTKAYLRLAKLFLFVGQGDLSLKCCLRVLAMARYDDERAEIMNAVACAYDSVYDLDAAEAYLEKAVSISASCLPAHHNRLMMMCYRIRHTMEETFEAHRRWASLVEKESSRRVHHTDCTPGRRLRVGYVSPDLRKHSVTYFFEPVLATHDKSGFETFCYALIAEEDETTARLKRHADHWRNLAHLTDEQALDRIRDDRIDILVDLAGHTGDNGLRLFAEKPAPVQVTWIGYPATTGLTSMDYRFVDEVTDPIGETDRYYSETLIRLPGCFLVYLPDRESPDISDLPALSNGFITFGSFNKLSKVTPEMITLWSRILKDLPRSRLVMKTLSLSDKTARARIAAMFAQEGIESERLILMPWATSTGGHLGTYHSVDIALDTYPYNGTTTTCEALWMGVPVVTLAGMAYGGRVGASLLRNVGLPELIASTTEEYRKVTLDLAADLPRLRSLRGNLRGMMRASPLMDYETFTRNVENAYREVWRKWCDRIA